MRQLYENSRDCFCLDVSFALPKSTIQHIQKTRKYTLMQYIFLFNSKSNHPPSVIKQLSIMINIRLNDLSCNKDKFDKATLNYSNTPKNSGYMTVN